MLSRHCCTTPPSLFLSLSYLYASFADVTLGIVDDILSSDIEDDDVLDVSFKLSRAYLINERILNKFEVTLEEFIGWISLFEMGYAGIGILNSLFYSILMYLYFR